MDTRGLCDLIQGILPAGFSPVMFAEAAETKDTTPPLTVKIKDRLEYNVLHEITQEFHLKGASSGYNRMADYYTIKLIKLPALEASLQKDCKQYKDKAKKISRNMLTRELNAFLQRSKPLLDEHVCAELTEAMALANSVAKLMYLYRIMPKLAANITPAKNIAQPAMQLLYGPALLSADALRPLVSYAEDLESSLGCCFSLFRSASKQKEFLAIIDLLERLRKPLVGHTVKILVDAVRVQLNLANTIFRTQLCSLLNDLDGSSRRPKANKEKLPLLPHQYSHRHSII